MAMRYRADGPEEDAERRRRVALTRIAQASSPGGERAAADRRMQAMMAKRERGIKAEEKLNKELGLASAIANTAMDIASGGISLATRGAGGLAKTAVEGVGAADKAAEAATKTAAGAIGKAAALGSAAASGGKSKTEKTTKRVLDAVLNPVQLGKEIGMALKGEAPFEERLKRFDQRMGRVAARRQRQLDDDDISAFVNFGRVIS